MAHTTRASFADHFDLGVPFDRTDGGQDRDLLMIYSKSTAMPNRMQKAGGNDKIEFIETAEELTENCDHMHVVYHHRGGGKNLCLAVVPQYESYHIQKWMRIPEKGPGDHNHPLRLVGRGMQWKGEDDFDPPKYERQSKFTWPKLRVYLETLEGIVFELKKIVNRIKLRNAVVVMVSTTIDLLRIFVTTDTDARHSGV